MRREDQGNLDALDRSPTCPFPDDHYIGGPVIAEVEDAHRRKPRVAELLLVGSLYRKTLESTTKRKHKLLVVFLYMKTLENSRNDIVSCCCFLLLLVGSLYRKTLESTTKRKHKVRNFGRFRQSA